MLMILDSEALSTVGRAQGSLVRAVSILNGKAIVDSVLFSVFISRISSIVILKSNRDCGSGSSLTK